MTTNIYTRLTEAQTITSYNKHELEHILNVSTVTTDDVATVIKGNKFNKIAIQDECIYSLFNSLHAIGYTEQIILEQVNDYYFNELDFFYNRVDETYYAIVGDLQ